MPRALVRAMRPVNLALYLLGVASTVLCIRLGIDEAARRFFLDHVPLGSTTERFLHLQVGMLWPILPALYSFRRGFYEKDRERIAGGCATLQAIIVTGLVTLGLKLLTGRPAPPTGAPASEWHFLDRANGANVNVMWPSGHTSEAFAASAAMATYHRAAWVRALVYAIAVAMGASMLAWNFHWLSDVIAGACLGYPIGRAVGENFVEWVDREEALVKRYRLRPDLELVLEQGDLTKARVDAIVNAANELMLGGGGVDGAIHRAAGDALYEHCKTVPEVRPGVRCPTGEARITPGFALPAKHVIHTVGPIYSSAAESAPLLASAYRSSVALAAQHGLRSVAFPAISCGVFGYPLDEAAPIALAECAKAPPPVAEIRFVLFTKDVLAAWTRAADALPPVR